MKKSLILQTAALFLMSLILLYSVFLLMRGHNAVGGGFAGGLSAASALALYRVAFDAKALRSLVKIHPAYWQALGLALTILSGLAGTFFSRPFLMGMWEEVNAGIFEKIKIGTPLIFDIGVYFCVIGSVLFPLIYVEEGDEKC